MYRRRYGARSRKYTGVPSRGMVDVFYQQIFAETTTGAVQSDTEGQLINLPQPPTQYVGSGSSILYELLKAEFQIEQPNIEVGHSLQWWAGLILHEPATMSSASLEIDSNNVLAMVSGGWQCILLTSGQTCYRTTNWEGPVVYDFQDQKGNGKLVASQNIVLVGSHSFSASATYAGVTFRVRIWYRFRKVALTEYIGLLTEQSATSQT